MHTLILHVLLALICCLPGFASAATSQSIHVEWGYTPPSTPAVTGFKLYQEGVFACQAQDPAATTMDCQVTLAAATTNFTLTATFSDGTESPHSAPFAFTLSSSAPLSAIIATDTLSGPAPLAVAFNAASSTGSIASYKWDFGDGSTATGATATHSYSAAGIYTAQLTITDAAGLTSTASATVNVSAATVAATPPTAVVSSSAAAGAAPLSVSFNGTGSTAAAPATIASYAWSFGDGSSATGASASHSFTSAGTYTTTLTVTDSKGLTNSASTPIVVTTALEATTNKTPTAVITATPASGAAPLVVSFDASGSADTDGSIATYVWNFGDGSTATGKTVTHTYNTAASYSATLKVTDNQGATASTSTTITAQAETSTADLNIETGEITVSSTWVRVPLTSTFTSPIVIAGPPGFNNAEPCVIRLRNVTPTGFEIKLAEWNYQDGTHPAETVSYLVMEKGRTILPNGAIVEAGTFTGATTNQTVKFSKAFSKIPVIMTTVASNNETDTISGRLSKITTSSFAYYFREQENNKNVHVKESVNFIAWEPGKGTIGSMQYEVGRTANAVTNAWYNATYQTSFSQAPMLLADMQTTANTDTSALRVQQPAATGFQVKVEEEQSKDSEVTHPAETVGYITFDKVD